MEEDKIIDQSQLAEDLSGKIPYEMSRQFLVKPLDPIMVTKEFTKPVSDKQPAKDENGIEAVDYDKTETEVKEVESDYRKAVVLKVPYEHTAGLYNTDGEKMSYYQEIKVGDVIVYRSGSGKWFDLLKDTQLISSYDIVAVER